jgi:GntR family transcriptional regulator of vanillate catabolism
VVAEQVARAMLAIRELVLEGELPPSKRVAEIPLSERIGLSRTPLRIALAELAHEGLLHALPGGGFVVREFTPRYVADAIELCGVLEGTAARLIAERHQSPEELLGLRERLSAMDGVLAHRPVTMDAFGAYSDENARFHEELIHLCDSEPIREALARAQRLPFAAPTAFVLATLEAAQSTEVLLLAQAQHRGLVEAIERREGLRAEGLAREHARLQHRNLTVALRNHETRKRVPGELLLG